MKCRICGAESGASLYCSSCVIKKNRGEITICQKCGFWHSPSAPCAGGGRPTSEAPVSNQDLSGDYLYSVKKLLISKCEQEYYSAILEALPKGYCLFPQVNLAAFIAKNDDSAFHNELFRNVDFLVTNDKYNPLFIIEINDQSHLNHARAERDEKVKKICEEAGVPIVKFWTSYGVNPGYIKKKVAETLASLPVRRVHHFDRTSQLIDDTSPLTVRPSTQSSSLYPTPRRRRSRRLKRGCYVATCVYGSYDCPEVWTLRRYRDETLAKTWYGRLFIHIYYAISPLAVKIFGKCAWFHNIFRPFLDKMVKKLSANGYEDTPYEDKNW